MKGASSNSISVGLAHKLLPSHCLSYVFLSGHFGISTAVGSHIILVKGYVSILYAELETVCMQ